MQVSRREALSVLGAVTCAGTIPPAAFLGPEGPDVRGRTYRDARERRNLPYQL